MAIRGATNLRTVGPLLALLAAPPVLAQAVSQWGFWSKWGDQRDGTYRNPVMPADFSDLDAIRVGREYFAISSTLHLSPGMAVLKSSDMVNWQLIGHVIPDLTVLGAEYRWDRMARFGRGVWAGTIRHHANRFWVFFGTPDEGFFMSSAADPAGPWTPLHPLLKDSGWDDCTVLWDDDGQAWFLGTNFAAGYKSYIMPMSADGRSIDRSRAVLVNEGQGREASKLLKHDGWYYIVFSEHVPGKGRYVVARRARRPTGPWSGIRQLADPSLDASEPNQGGIIEAPSGKHYFLTHHGKSSWEGRAASLLPITWIDGWPIVGRPNAQGIGTMVWDGPKPVHGKGRSSLVTSDEFSAKALGPHWEWNHQPRPGSWSLSERPGWLRLRALQPIGQGNLGTASSVPSQRSMRTPANAVTVKLDISRMADGQHAGLGHISKAFGALGARQTGGRRILEYLGVDGAITGPQLGGANLWLRSSWASNGLAEFAYSIDGRRFVRFGPAYQMSHAYYRGDRVSLYSYSDAVGRGWVDADYFRYFYRKGNR